MLSSVDLIDINCLDKISPDTPLLHGTLSIHAIEAKNLPDTDNFFFNISRGDLTDPYLELSLGPASLIKTRVIRNCLDPVWDEKFNVSVCHYADAITVKVIIEQINLIDLQGVSKKVVILVFQPESWEFFCKNPLICDQ